VPDVYLFRKTADVLYRADKANEEMEQLPAPAIGCGSAGLRAPRATTRRAIRASSMPTISSTSSKPACGNGSPAAAW